MAPPVIVRRRQIAFVLLLFALSFGLLQWFAYRQKSATWDEPIHLAAGYAALARGDYRPDASHPPFMRMWAALPLLFMDDVRLDTAAIDRATPAEWQSGSRVLAYGSTFLYADNDGDRLLNAGRLMIVLCGIGLGLLVFAWAYEWLGFGPAVGALAFYTLSPTVLANTSVVTTDAGITCFIFGTVYFLWRTARRCSAGNVAGLLTFFALAIVTKFSAVILGPLILVLLVVAARTGGSITPRRIAALVPGLAMAAVLAIWAVYGFRYAPTPAGDWILSLESAPLAQTVPTISGLTAWIDRHRLLPNSFTEGFLIFAQSTTTTTYTFLAGNYSMTGWWYYFPVAFLIKTPVGLLALIGIGAAVCVLRRRQLGGINELFLFVPVAMYLATAMNSPFQVGIRHILPVYPFLFVVAAAGVQVLLRTRAGRVTLAVPVAAWVVMLASVYPYTLTFFNVMVGGPGNGSRYLADSNVDWGQGLKALKSWMTRQEVAHVNLAYFGSADPAYYGISYTRLPAAAPGFQLTEAPAQWTRPVLPGYVAVSATVLTGVYLDEHWRLFYSGLRHRTPEAIVGNSIFVYHLDRWPEANYAAYPDLGPGEADRRLGNELLQVQWFDRAIVHYQRALAHTPGDAAMLQHLGAALLAAGDAAAAAPALQRAVAGNPDAGLAHLLLATALFDLRRPPDEVIVHARRAATLLPANRDALLLLARTLGVRGDLLEGQAVAARALRLNPADREAVDLMAAFDQVMR